MVVKKLLPLAVVLSSLSCASVLAADGVINFTGTIIDTACTVTNNPTNPLAVNLGKVKTSAFKAIGDTAASTAFNIQLTACPSTVSSARVTFDGMDVPGTPGVLALTGGTGVANGLGIQLSDDANGIVPLHTASKSYDLSPTVPVNLRFVARYVATAATVTTGPANATSSFTIAYN